MFQSWKKSGASGNARIKSQRIKEKLLEELLNTMKELQKNVLNSGCFDISRNDEFALHLTFILEAIFLHGHQASVSVSRIFNKSSSSGVLPSPDFWDILEPFTHKDVLHQLAHLSHINTQVGKCRAWLRLALNDGLMESYIHAILLEKKAMGHHYSPKAFLRDTEATSILMNHFLGLIELNFDLNHNTPSLNQWTAVALQLSGTWEPPTAPTAIVAQPEGVPQPLSVPKAAIQTSPQHVVLPLSPQRPAKEQGKASKSTCHAHDGTPKEAEQDGSSVEDNVKHSNNEIKDHQETTGITDQVDDLGTSPAVEARVFPSPTNHRGGNMLGMDSGWSSSFESPEPARRELSDQPQKNPEASERTPAKPMISFHGMLSDYEITGPKRFSPTPYDPQSYSLPDGKESFNEFEKSISGDKFVNEKSSGFEIIADSSTPEESYLLENHMTLMSTVNDIPREKGLDKQHYKCKGCSRPIGMIYGQYKVCSFDGSYYCYECHVDDEHVIPARIIHNWDLGKYKVAKHTKLFLMYIDEEPVFHIDEVNPTLYNVISEINKVKHLRIQLQHLKGYMMTCKNTMISEDVKRRMWPREYLWDDIHQYSLLDLIQVNSGQLQHHLKKIISFCKKHVYGCEVCSQKGFICEICKNVKIVYAFEVHLTSQCPRCKAVFHKACKTDRQCPRCVRRRSRQQSPEVATTEHEQSGPALNSLF